MELYEVLARRRSVRRYTAEPVAAANVTERITEAGRSAPISMSRHITRITSWCSTVRKKRPLSRRNGGNRGTKETRCTERKSCWSFSARSRYRKVCAGRMPAASLTRCIWRRRRKDSARCISAARSGHSARKRVTCETLTSRPDLCPWAHWRWSLTQEDLAPWCGKRWSRCCSATAADLTRGALFRILVSLLNGGIAQLESA